MPCSYVRPGEKHSNRIICLLLDPWCLPKGSFAGPQKLPTSVGTAILKPNLLPVASTSLLAVCPSSTSDLSMTAGLTIRVARSGLCAFPEPVSTVGSVELGVPAPSFADTTSIERRWRPLIFGENCHFTTFVILPEPFPQPCSSARMFWPAMCGDKSPSAPGRPLFRRTNGTIRKPWALALLLIKCIRKTHRSAPILGIRSRCDNPHARSLKKVLLLSLPFPDGGSRHG
jgi:hypothetical protein